MYDGHPAIFKCDLPLPQISWIHDSEIIWSTGWHYWWLILREINLNKQQQWIASKVCKAGHALRLSAI